MRQRLRTDHHSRVGISDELAELFDVVAVEQIGVVDEHRRTLAVPRTGRPGQHRAACGAQ